ncbi:MAG: hypothetical protein ACE365_06235 [Gammaproteobacteria bacterium]
MRIAFIFLLTFFLTACATRVPDLSYTVPRGIYSRGQVRKAVLAAAEHDHWQAKHLKPGLIVARKDRNQEMLEIYIAYGYHGYNIDYANSENMQYQFQNEQISRDYLKWVLELNNEIQVQLNKIAWK